MAKDKNTEKNRYFGFTRKMSKYFRFEKSKKIGENTAVHS